MTQLAIFSLSPALSPSVSPGDAPALGGLRSTDAGESTSITAWVFARSKKYNGAGGSYLDARPVCRLADAVAAGEWEAMQDETFDNGFSAWGGEVDGYYTLDVSTYHRRAESRYVVFMLPSWIVSDLHAATWHRAMHASSLGAIWLAACPRLAEIEDFGTFVNVCNFLKTKPRAAARVTLKAALVEWLDGGRDFPREAEWMTRPYDRNAAARSQGFRTRRWA